MPSETSVHLRLDSAALFEAVKREVGAWRLEEHRFDPQADEVRVSYDSGGSGRVAVTVGFEFDQEVMRRLLQQTPPAG